MSAATFTPGPWKIGKQFGGYQFFAPHNELIPISGADGYVAYVTADKFDRAGSRNAARLIAAAPDLLEACKLAYARLKPGDIRKDYSGHVAHVAMAKAIAKAEGSAE